jgi:poly-D-alanine transfer protein DltD
MKKVILLGDSIRLNYQEQAALQLGADFNVWGPGENCRFSTYTLNSIRFWAEDMKGADIIHWNNGIWDIEHIYNENRSFTTLDHYIEDMSRILHILKQTGAKVIFATTTPLDKRFCVPSMCPVIEEYNNTLLDKIGTGLDGVNDLYSLVKADTKKYLIGDGCHLSELGMRVCGKAVSDKIKETAFLM